MQNYFVYILTNKSQKILYTGMTDDLMRRHKEHKDGIFPGFTKRYSVSDLVYYEVLNDLEAAILREKQLKKWRRDKKMALITKQNPNWDVLIFKEEKDCGFLAALDYSAPAQIDPSTSLGIKRQK